jgi:SAM-dependent methyltransferase
MTIDSAASAAEKLAERYMDGRYLHSNNTWHEEDSPYKAELVKSTIIKNSIEFASCADIGCGAGLVTEILAKTFPDSSFTGYDVSSDAKGFWGHRLAAANLTYLNEDFLAAKEKYDLILCLDVIEHVEDYFGFLRAIRSKGKAFIFNVPLDMNAMRIFTPGIKYARERYGHLHYFNEYSALETLKDCGFEIKNRFLSAPFAQLLPRNFLQALIVLPRLILMSFGKSFGSKVLGGYSLVITCGSGR